MPTPRFPLNNTEPAGAAIAVTPNDGADLPTAGCRALYVGVGGDVSLDDISGNTAIVFKNVPSGFVLPVMVKRVRVTGTVATSILALY